MHNVFTCKMTHVPYTAAACRGAGKKRKEAMVCKLFSFSKYADKVANNEEKLWANQQLGGAHTGTAQHKNRLSNTYCFDIDSIDGF